jgi:hypothetical protein
MSTAPLTLRALPSLLTDCVIVGHAQKADVIFTPPEFFAMCAHMMNENSQNFFLTAYRDKDGKPRFAKPYSYRANALKRAQWAWDTIKGTAKNPTGIGFYPTNGQKQSRWAAMDFDAHDGDAARARELSHKAFAVLIREPKLYVALCTSAGDPVHTGWHLFIFTEDFHDVDKWTRLLKQVAEQIGAPIQPGVCEIYPDGSRGIGRGIRAPASWNPKTGDCGLVLRETFTKLLPAALPAGTAKEREELCSLYSSCPTQGKILRTASSEKFRITAPGTRHGKLLELVGAEYRQRSKEDARKLARIQHAEAHPAPVASLDEHLAEFDDAWAGMDRKWKRDLSPAEREKFDSLTTERERDAFRILRNWSQTDWPDFYAHCETLADRLGIKPSGAAKIRRRFCSLGMLRQTAQYVPRKLAARYEWCADKPSNSHYRELLEVTQP